MQSMDVSCPHHKLTAAYVGTKNVGINTSDYNFRKRIYLPLLHHDLGSCLCTISNTSFPQRQVRQKLHVTLQMMIALFGTLEQEFCNYIKEVFRTHLCAEKNSGQVQLDNFVPLRLLHPHQECVSRDTWGSASRIGWSLPAITKDAIWRMPAKQIQGSLAGRLTWLQ